MVPSRVADPHSFHPDPDPAFRLNTDPDPIRIRIQGFKDQKFKKKLQLKKIHFFGSKTTIYLSLGLYKERPSYRISL
jgi:hypothetical protein